MVASRGRGARTKGAAGERELFKLLNAALEGEPFRRNLIQTRAGGADTEAHHPVSIEVKRQEMLRLKQWIDQMREQAEPGQTPVLAYRRNGESWNILVDMSLEQFITYLVETHGYERKHL